MRSNAQKRPRDGNRVILPNGFQKAYYNCTNEQMDQVKAELMAEFKCTNTTFYNKMRGRFSFTQEEINSVEKVFGTIGIDAWSGQRKFTDTKTE